MMNYKKIKKAFFQALQNLKSAFPILIGMLLLISILNNLLKDVYKNIFTGNTFIDSILGALAGGVSFGMPITSYIIGGELRDSGISLVAVTAFILAWTTVGVAMLPLEASFLGKKFAIYRNIINFFFAMIIAALTVFTLGLF